MRRRLRRRRRRYRKTGKSLVLKPYLGNLFPQVLKCIMPVWIDQNYNNGGNALSVDPNIPDATGWRSGRIGSVDLTNPYKYYVDGANANYTPNWYIQLSQYYNAIRCCAVKYSHGFTIGGGSTFQGRVYEVINRQAPDDTAMQENPNYADLRAMMRNPSVRWKWLSEPEGGRPKCVFRKYVKLSRWQISKNIENKQGSNNAPSQLPVYAHYVVVGTEPTFLSPSIRVSWYGKMYLYCANFTAFEPS